jgi:predicted small lipoprotein YifL
VVLTRTGDRRLLRLAALVALAGALALGGCGRKGALDQPPSASVNAPPAPDERRSLGQNTDPNMPGFLRAPQPPAAAAAPSTTASRPPERSFFLDFLIK